MYQVKTLVQLCLRQSRIKCKMSTEKMNLFMNHIEILELFSFIFISWRLIILQYCRDSRI